MKEIPSLRLFHAYCPSDLLIRPVIMLCVSDRVRLDINTMIALCT